MFKIVYKKDIYVNDFYLGTSNEGTYYVRYADFDLLEDLGLWIENEITHYKADEVDFKNLKIVFDNMNMEIEYFVQVYEDEEFIDGDRILLSDFLKVKGVDENATESGD